MRKSMRYTEKDDSLIICLYGNIYFSRSFSVAFQSIPFPYDLPFTIYTYFFKVVRKSLIVNHTHPRRYLHIKHTYLDSEDARCVNEENVHTAGGI